MAHWPVLCENSDSTKQQDWQDQTGVMMKSIEFAYTALEAVHVGQTVLEALPAKVAQSGHQRVLLVSNRSLSSANNDFAELQQALAERCVGVFTQVRAHTPREDVLALLVKVTTTGADLLIAIGGGSVIDACKTVQLAVDLGLQDEEDLLEYAQRGDGQRGRRAGNAEYYAASSTIRQWAVPTTLSGAEYSNNAGVLDTQRSAKEGYRAPRLCPQHIFYDPQLGQQTPEWLWLSTAIRSLDHAIEGYCSAGSHAFLNGHFLHAMRLFAASLPVVKQNPDDLDARSLNQQAVWLACCGLGTVPHGASHGIGYILGSLCGVPHGYTSCVMLPAVLQWNADALAGKQDDICAALGGNSGSGKNTAADTVRELIAGLGLPTSLESVGVEQSQWPEIARRAIQHPVVRNNPKPLTEEAQVMELLRLASQP